MFKKLLALLPVAGVLALVTPSTPAQAGMTGALALPASELSQSTDIVNVARRFRRLRRGRRRGLRRWGPRIVLGFGAPAYYGYRYRRGCHWLKRRARNTGSRYWWRRYRNCRYRSRYY